MNWMSYQPGQWKNDTASIRHYEPYLWATSAAEEDEAKVLGHDLAAEAIARFPRKVLSLWSTFLLGPVRAVMMQQNYDRITWKQRREWIEQKQAELPKVD